jgi:hypothetical protein
MENTYKVIKVYKKEADQSWSKMYVNVKGSLNSVYDPRDDYDGNLEEVQMLKEMSQEVKSWPGYLGWDREYLTDNMMTITRYFDTGENATNFLKHFTKQSEGLRKLTESVYIGKYTTYWYMVTPQGTVISK